VRALKDAAEHDAIVYVLLAAGGGGADADVDIAVDAIERAAGIVGHPYTPPRIMEVSFKLKLNRYEDSVSIISIMSFNKLPEVIIELIGIYLIPAKECHLKKINTIDIDNFCISGTIINNTIKNSKSCRPLYHKCPPPVKLLGKLSCRLHTPLFDKKQRIHKAITKQIHNSYIHFDSKSDADFAQQYIGSFTGNTCCRGKGYKWNGPGFARSQEWLFYEFHFPQANASCQPGQLCACDDEDWAYGESVL